jgi:hypothetical protein
LKYRIFRHSETTALHIAGGVRNGNEPEIAGRFGGRIPGIVPIDVPAMFTAPAADNPAPPRVPLIGALHVDEGRIEPYAEPVMLPAVEEIIGRQDA